MDIFQLGKNIIIFSNCQSVGFGFTEYSKILESEVFIVHLKYKFKLFHIIYPVLKRGY